MADINDWGRTDRWSNRGLEMSTLKMLHGEMGTRMRTEKPGQQAPPAEVKLKEKASQKCVSPCSLEMSRSHDVPGRGRDRTLEGVTSKWTSWNSPHSWDLGRPRPHLHVLEEQTKPVLATQNCYFLWPGVGRRHGHMCFLAQRIWTHDKDTMLTCTCLPASSCHTKIKPGETSPSRLSCSRDPLRFFSRWISSSCDLVWKLGSRGNPSSGDIITREHKSKPQGDTTTLRWEWLSSEDYRWWPARMAVIRRLQMVASA
jgi:hypothetical protein